MEVLNNIARKAHTQWPSPYWASKPNRHERRRVRHQIQHGRRVAVERAFGGARLYLAGLVPTLVAAARSSGSTVSYVTAAIVVLQSGDTRLQAQILAGNESLLAAARRAKPVLETVKTYNLLDEDQRRAFFNAAGTDRVLDDLATAS